MTGVAGNLDIATTVMAECLGEFAAGARPLVIDEATGALAVALGSKSIVLLPDSVGAPKLTQEMLQAFGALAQS